LVEGRGWRLSPQVAIARDPSTPRLRRGCARWPAEA